MVDRRLWVVMVLLSVSSAYGMGRKAGDGYAIEPVKRGSAANPNPAFSAPDWGEENHPSRPAPERQKTSRAEKKAAPKLAAPDEPEAAAPHDNFPDYATTQPETTPKAAAVKPVPLSKDSLEPPLPEEAGGDPDKRPSK